MLAAFETLVEAGYDPQLAYMECCQEFKQVADLLYARGPAAMMAAISNSAEFGAHRTIDTLLSPEFKAVLKAMLDDVRDGSFTEEFAHDYAGGFTWFDQQRATLAAHPIEEAGEAVRAWMPWLGDEEKEVGGRK